MDSAISAIHSLGIPIRHVSSWEDLHRAYPASVATCSGLVKTSQAEPSWMKAFGPVSTVSQEYLGYAFKDPGKAKTAIVSAVNQGNSLC